MNIFIHKRNEIGSLFDLFSLIDEQTLLGNFSLSIARESGFSQLWKLARPFSQLKTPLNFINIVRAVRSVKAD